MVCSFRDDKTHFLFTVSKLTCMLTDWLTLLFGCILNLWIHSVSRDAAEGWIKVWHLPPLAVVSVLSAPRCVFASQPVVGACAPRSAAARVADGESAPTAPYWPAGGAGSPASVWNSIVQTADYLEIYKEDGNISKDEDDNYIKTFTDRTGAEILGITCQNK